MTDPKKNAQAAGKTNADKKDSSKPKASIKENFNAKARRPTFGGRVASIENQTIKLKRDVYLITSAQNNTKVHEGFLKSLETCAKYNNAQLIISQFTYDHTGFQNSTKDGIQRDKSDVRNLTYDKKILPYLLPEFRKDAEDHNGANKSIELAKGLIFGGEINTLPTAVNPLSGFETYFRGNNSGIIPHVKHAMLSLNGMKEDGARFLYTTGAVTKRNYIQKKAGQKADKHHVYGALIVEVDRATGEWFVRQIAADKTGGFYDLDKKYLPNGTVLENQRPEAITWGDIHVEKIDETVRETAFGKNGMLDTLNPKYQFMHDVIDFTSRNHHNIKDEWFRAAQHFSNPNGVEDEISLTAAFLKAAQRPNTQTIVVEGNHDRAFTRWLKDVENIKGDPKNAAYFHECLAKVYREFEKGNMVFAERVFEWAVRQKEQLDKTYFLPRDTSFVICEGKGGGDGIECGLHGDIGPNGSKGTPRGLRKLSRKANTGHTHTAGIIDGVYTAGLLANLIMGYNVGPSAWSHSNILTYPNGARSIITMKNGKWRADHKEHAAKAPRQRRNNLGNSTAA